MTKERLRERAAEAASPNDISSVLFEARLWLADHPDDPDIVLTVANLILKQDLLVGRAHAA